MIEAVVVALRTHPKVAGVQEQACRALINVCDGDDAAGRARRLRATRAGGRTVAVAAMQAHPDDDNVQDFSQRLRYVTRMMIRCSAIQYGQLVLDSLPVNH